MYYWVLVQVTSLTRHEPFYSDYVIDKHPFEWIKEQIYADIHPMLFNWKQITKEEYELYSK